MVSAGGGQFSRPGFNLLGTEPMVSPDQNRTRGERSLKQRRSRKSGRAPGVSTLSAVFRSEPEAELRREERKRPDSRHRGIEIVERSYVLATHLGDVDLPPGTAEAVLVGQGEKPVLVAEAEGRYWWMYEDRIYSAAEWLSRGTVAALADGTVGADESWGSRLRGRVALTLSPPAGIMPLMADVSPLLVV